MKGNSVDQEGQDGWESSSDEDGPISSRTRSKFAVIEEPLGGNVFNPFLMPPVLRNVLKCVETPDLKDLRSTSSLWNKMVSEEMEIRAWKGEYSQVGFDWSLYLYRIRRDPIWAGKSLWNFLRQTRASPNLFRSFHLQFPEAPLVLDRPHFSKSFKNYSPRFLELSLPFNVRFTDDAKNLLRGFLNLMAPTLREFTITRARNILAAPIPGQDAFEGVLMLPKLEKLTLGQPGQYGYFSRSATNAFTTLFGQRDCQIEMPNLRELEILTVFGHFEDLFGIHTVDPIRWRSLTSLQIELKRPMYDGDGISKFMNGLLFLVRSGMALEELILKLFVNGEFSHQASGNLSQLLESQAKSLQNLSLNLQIYAMEYDDQDLEEAALVLMPKIALPRCPCLKFLDMSSAYFRYMDDDAEFIELFNLISIPRNFPNLKTLSLSSPYATTMALLRKPVDPAERRHLDTFEYNSHWEDSDWEDEDYANLFNTFSTVGEMKIN